MRNTVHQLILVVVVGLVFLGAGCKKAPPPAPDGGLKPAATAPADPLADDLDAAIEDLDALEE